MLICLDEKLQASWPSMRYSGWPAAPSGKTTRSRTQELLYPIISSEKKYTLYHICIPKFVGSIPLEFFVKSHELFQSQLACGTAGGPMPVWQRPEPPSSRWRRRGRRRFVVGFPGLKTGKTARERDESDVEVQTHWNIQGMQFDISYCIFLSWLH